ncbi:MAG: hypothetical protein NVS2B14_10390 [Chamaesiphon sp.]
MVTLVVVLNTLIALFCFYVTWRIRKLRRQVAKIADTLTSAERSTYSVLKRGPEAISKGQKGTHRLTERYQRLEHQLQRVQKVLALLRLLQKVWQQQSTSKRSKIVKTPIATLKR